MKDYIINSFILQDKNSLIDIYNYIKLRYDNLVEINDIKTELTKLIKNNIIFFHNKNYKLSNAFIINCAVSPNSFPLFIRSIAALS